MGTQCWLKILGSLLIVEIVSSRTIVHHKTTTTTNGDAVTKSWTTSHEDDTESKSPHNTEVLFSQDAPQLSEQTEIIRIGGSNIPTEELLQNSELIRGIDPDAISELLRTKQPVVRTKTDTAGHKRTTTLTLEADGSILSRTVTNVQPEEIKPITSSWNPKTHFSSSRSGTNFGSSPDEWPSFRDIWQPQTSTMKTPSSWNTETWSKPIFNFTLPSRPDVSYFSNTDPKPFKTFDDAFKHPYDTNTITNFTYTPWRQTFNWTSINEPTDEVWKKPTTPTFIDLRKSIKPTRTIDIEDLPITGILNNGKPVDGNIYGTHLWPETTVNTFKIKNIPEGKDWSTTETQDEPKFETHVKTFTQNVFSNTLPSATDLDPKAREILERAGISPDDVKQTGDTITKTRETPDGRVITTTYTVRGVPTFNMDGVKPGTAEETINNPGFRYPSFEHFPARPVDYDEQAKSRTNTASNKGPIEEYLSKVNLTPKDILDKNGELKRTITTEDGEVLTVTFMLSSVPTTNRENRATSEHVRVPKPIK